MKKLFALIALLCPLILFAQFEVMDSGTNHKLEDVYFIDENTGVAVGDMGTIIRTTDGGVTWTTVMTVDTITLYEVGFFDELNGIATGNHTYISSDGGATWETSFESEMNTSFFADLEIVNSTTCYLSTYHIGLLKSTDHGQTWDTLNTANQSFLYKAMNFMTEEVGYTSSQLGPPTESILKTTDGGVNWDTLVSSSPWNNTVLEEIVFVDENIGFQAGWYNAHFIKTTDGGGTWYVPEITDDITGQLLDLDISPERPNSYYACGWYGEILKSTNQGDSWHRIDNGIGESNSMNAIFFVDDLNGWVVGDQGMVLRTTNGGEVLSTNEATPEHDILIYPNPAGDVFQVDLIQAAEHNVDRLIIFDYQGKKVADHNWESIQNGVDVSALPAGIYTVRLMYEDNVAFRSKFVKEQ